MQEKTLVVVSTIITVILVAVAAILLTRQLSFQSVQVAELQSESKIWGDDKTIFVDFIETNNPVMSWGANKKESYQIGILYDFLNGQDVEKEWEEEKRENWALVIGFFVYTYLPSQKVQITSLTPILKSMGSLEKPYSWEELKDIDQTALRNKIFEVYPIITTYFSAPKEQ